MTDNLPPYDASPENLMELCAALREGEMEQDDLLEHVDMKQTTFEQNVDYGIQLGFISESEDVLEATTRGQQYGYGNLPAKREQGLFQDAIREHTTYQEFITVAQAEIQEENGEPAILVEGLTRELRIAYDYGVKDRTLESVVATLQKTLDAAGFGDYILGRQGYSTRLEVGEGLEDFVAELAGDEGGPEEEDNTGEERPSKGDSEPARGELEEDVEEEGERSYESGENSTSDINGLLGSLDIDAGGVELNIDINISSADWDSDEVIKLVNAIRENDEN